MFKKFIWFIAGVLTALSFTTAIALSPIPPFDDVGEFSNWYRDAVRNMQLKGVIKGYDDYTFRPDNTLTRAEHVVTLDRLYELLNTEHSADIDSRNYLTADDVLTEQDVYDILVREGLIQIILP